ncbi:MAG: DUF4124 domain-containing protein [Gammaproteobacteria bacterium]
MRNLLLLVGLLPVLVGAAEVYRWVDDEGQPHYSDRPREGAEIIVIPDAQTYSAPAQRTGRQRATTSSGRSTREAGEAAGYSNFEIVSPKQEEVLWNIGGELGVSLRARPDIRSGHAIYLILDGRAVQQLSRGRLQATLQEVVRGTHTLQAEVRDARGNSIARSAAVTFTVQQTSLQNPNNPNSPVSTPLATGPAG